MAWDETAVWNDGTTNQDLYQQLLDDAETAPARNAERKKIVRPADMPWEMSRQGLLKHLINEGMNTPDGNRRRIYADCAARVEIGQAPAFGRRVLVCAGRPGV